MNRSLKFSYLKGMLSVLILISIICSAVKALHTEDVGNKQLYEMNYQDWPGVMPLINNKHRTFQTWTNGNEHFYYAGNTKSLNDFLKKYVTYKIDHHEVILRPGPSSTIKSEDEIIDYDWYLHIRGGISLGKAMREENTKVFEKFPTLTIFIGKDNIDLKEMKIPQGITLLELSDLRQRYLKGLESQDHEVRGYAAYFLGEIDFYHKENVPPLANLLNDENHWVRLMAAQALGCSGQNAKSALPTLRADLQDANESIRTRFQETIHKIENAKDTTKTAKEQQILLSEITKFCKTYNQLPSETNAESVPEKNNK